MIKKLDIAQASIATSLSKGNSMNFKRNITTALLLAALGTLGTTAFAEEPLRGGDRVVGEIGQTVNELSGRTTVQPTESGARERVKAELAEAVRNGDILVGATGVTRNQVNPRNYPAKPTMIGKTREQVKVETAEAIRAGDIPHGELSLKANEQFPQLYAKMRKQRSDDAAVSADTNRSDSVTR